MSVSGTQNAQTFDAGLPFWLSGASIGFLRGIAVMKSAHRYRHAPIVEAVVEFRFDDEVDERNLDRIARKLRTEFPIQEDKQKREYEIEIQQDGSLSSRTKLDKVREEPIKILTDSDGARILRLTPTSISVSRLPPYECFYRLRVDAEHAWDSAYSILGVRKLVRIGLRYINRIDLPYDNNGLINFEEYLNLRINIPEKYEHINRYSLIFEHKLYEIGCRSKVRSSVADPALIDHESFLLDIDVFKSEELPVKKSDVFDLLEKMREAKNEMFESFVTDKSRAMFDAD